MRTDHHTLKWLMSFKQPEGLVAHWLERLQEYDFTVEHCPGLSHANTDALFCRPRQKHGSCPSCGDTEYLSAALLQQNKAKEVASKTQEKKFSWTTDKIAQAQCSDQILTHRLQGWEKVNPNHCLANFFLLSPISRAIWAQHKLLEVKDNVLQIHPKERTRKLKSRIVPPEPLVKLAVQWLHDGLEGSHLGQLKTLQKVQARVWRPGIATTVKDHCTAC